MGCSTRGNGADGPLIGAGWWAGMTDSERLSTTTSKPWTGEVGGRRETASGRESAKELAGLGEPTGTGTRRGALPVLRGRGRLPAPGGPRSQVMIVAVQSDYGLSAGLMSSKGWKSRIHDGACSDRR